MDDISQTIEEDGSGPLALGMLGNVKVAMTVEVGRTQVTLQDLLRLNEGSVVELDRMAGDPLDILVNGTPIAKGEVVVVGEKVGIRFGDIIDPKARFESV
jgi:flagellar motor switch protein FliN/FliY